MAEVAGIVLGFMVLAFLMWTGFVFGKDAASRQAQATIASLRQHCKNVERQRDDARAELNQVRRAIRDAQLRNVEVPKWMK